MWPTQVSGSSPPRRWSDRGLASRVLAILGIAALLVGASIATWLSIRGGPPAPPPPYGAGRAGPRVGLGRFRLGAAGATQRPQHSDPGFGDPNIDVRGRL